MWGTYSPGQDFTDPPRGPVADVFHLQSRPVDATLTVTRAAQVLGVHPNTIRAWSDAGRLRYYRINPRGDRRYRMGDLQRFISSAASPVAPVDARSHPRLALVPDGEHRTVEALAAIGDAAAAAMHEAASDPDAPLKSAVRTLRGIAGATLAVAWRLDDDKLTPVAISGTRRRRLASVPRSFGILGEALDRSPAVLDLGPADAPSVTLHAGRELACSIPGPSGPWGVLLVATRETEPASRPDRDSLASMARAIGQVVRAAGATTEIAQQLHRAEALRRVSADIGSRLDLEQILSGVVEHATVLFGADRAAVYLFEADGSRRIVASRGLSPAFQAAVQGVAGQTLAQASVEARRPLFAVGYRDDPRAGALRAAIIQEGFDTACLAPLLDGPEPDALGVLGVYHDSPHEWTAEELDTIAELATQAGVAIKAARTYDQLATWAAQLQSIQPLGARLNRLTSVAEIGSAIATGLRQLIDYHNVRVYRLIGDDLVPVAMQGQVGEYVDETPEMLRVKYGEGITGWVAKHRAAQLLDDASADPRAQTIPGTVDDLDESMLLAPMLFEDQVLGVLVLSKLGLRQFQPDDLRLLVIYASFAAQAMANADATERLREQSAALEQKVRSQRQLLRLTESILMTYDVAALLEATADRIGDLVQADNLVIELVDPVSGELVPKVARGSDSAFYLRPHHPDRVGLSNWVADHNQPQLVPDQYDDARCVPFDRGRLHGGIACVPLRGRDGAVGVIEIERIGNGRSFSEDEFELIQLFAAQVSVGLQNAEAHEAVEHRAQTDVLTGLMNHGTFVERMNRHIAADEPFSLVMLDLDRFKGVNDGFGHQAGDRLLRQVAESIVGASRDSDAVFRYGGDEFAVLPPGTDGEAVAAIAERIRAAVAAVVGPGSGWRGRARALEASAGTSSYPDDGGTAEEVLLAADRACFVAKRSGGGRVASAAEGLAIAGELTLQTPTPIDPVPSGVS
jgi:diguanylate cyclase (GGDEF)-like protein/excisionase family DNA binding protein